MLLFTTNTVLIPLIWTIGLREFQNLRRSSLTVGFKGRGHLNISTHLLIRVQVLGLNRGGSEAICTGVVAVFISHAGLALAIYPLE